MEIRSRGYRTDLIFPRFEGVVADRGDCVVVRTPSNPAFYWGNFLLFAHPPDGDSLPAWTRRFRAEIASVQRARHVALGWDSPEGERGAVEPFLAEGFILSENAVLTAKTLVPPRHCNADVQIRPLAADAVWAQALENHVAVRGGEFAEAEYRPFKARQLALYRRMTDAGLGAWFGAFVGARLVADLGVFTDGSLARFQQVGTHPDFRSRGICGTLVYESARYARTRLGVERLVMTADEHYHAGRTRPAALRAFRAWRRPAEDGLRYVYGDGNERSLSSPEARTQKGGTRPGPALSRHPSTEAGQWAVASPRRSRPRNASATGTVKVPSACSARRSTARICWRSMLPAS